MVKTRGTRPPSGPHNGALSAYSRALASLIRFESLDALMSDLSAAVVGADDYARAFIGYGETGDRRPIGMAGRVMGRRERGDP